MNEKEIGASNKNSKFKMMFEEKKKKI